jgi:hypothetical protein
LAKHLKLQYTDLQPVQIIGIVSSANHLKLSWAINQSFEIQLSEKENITITNSKTGQTFEHSLFQFENESNLLKYSLVQNKISGITFFDDLKNIDYLFVIKGELGDYEKDFIFQTLRKTPDIATFISINIDSLKKKERLELF